MREETTKPRVLACQHGARRRYAMPRMLERAGMLTALYTDSSANSRLGKCAALCGQRAPAVVKRLAGREIRGIPHNKVYSSDAYNMYEIGQKLLGIGKKGFSLFRQRDRMLSSTMEKWGLQGADTLYTMYHDNLDFVRWAKSKGTRIVVDVYINPQTHEMMEREITEFPDWGGGLDESTIRQEIQMWKEIAGLGDLLLCPSEWVAKGVRNLTPEASAKIRIVPYGCSIDFHGQVNNPIKGRVLFAGGDALRKGLRCLAKAVPRLKSILPELDVRIAGMLPSEVTEHSLCHDLNFLGKLSLDRMKEEYLSADLLVLPALSEGFAGVVAEAINAGCPVVVTPEAGSPVVDGREGLVVPARNVEALAEAVERIITDRAFRKNCAAACLQQVGFYSETQWHNRLVSAITGF